MANTTTGDPPPQQPPQPRRRPYQSRRIPQFGQPFPSDFIPYPFSSSGPDPGPTHYTGSAVIHHPQLPEPVSNLRSHPLPKDGPSTCAVPENNAPKDLIDKKSDDLLVTLRDRKVRLLDGASLYALCRSWLRNGCPEDNQPQYDDVLISLPKPLPLPDTSSPKRMEREREDETYFDEAEKDDTLSVEELLTRHVKRAKRVRARLREERLHRVERYKTRLAALLQPNGLIQE